MIGKKRAPVTAVASILPLVAGLVIGYAGRVVFAPGSENSGSSALSTAERAHPSPQAESGERKQEFALKAGAKHPKETRSGKALHLRSARTYERFPDTAASIRDLHESMPEPGLVVWPGKHDPHLASSDDPELDGENDAARENAYHHQTDLIAELESQLNPPAVEPDEAELENQYLYDGLPEIEEWEELETLRDEGQAQDLDESENPIPLEEEPLPPIN
jgi:hypothetical protein